jgi:hypothetical protein
MQSDPLDLNIRPLTNTARVEPAQAVNIPVIINSGSSPSQHQLSWYVEYQANKISSPHNFEVVVAPPGLSTSLKIWLYQSLHQQNFRSL